MADAPNRSYKDQYMLRLPDGLRDRIAASAKRNGRSMNSEIVAVLENQYPAPTAYADLLERMKLLIFDAERGSVTPDLLKAEVALLRQEIDLLLEASDIAMRAVNRDARTADAWLPEKKLKAE